MRIRFCALMLGVGAYFLQATPAFADMLPSFPDPAARETSLILFIGLLFAAAVSGTSLLLLRRMARQRVQPTPSTEEPGVAGSHGDAEPNRAE